MLTLRDKEGKPAWTAEQLWPSDGVERKSMDNGPDKPKPDNGIDQNAIPPAKKGMVLPPPC
jgi:hypothetical protein